MLARGVVLAGLAKKIAFGLGQRVMPAITAPLALFEACTLFLVVKRKGLFQRLAFFGRCHKYAKTAIRAKKPPSSYSVVVSKRASFTDVQHSMLLPSGQWTR